MFAERFPAVHWADLPLPVFRSRLRYLCLMPGLPVVQVQPTQAAGAEGGRKKIIYIDRSGSQTPPGGSESSQGESSRANLTIRAG